ncbi:MAG: hypothetical protein ACXV5U_07105 [Ilumatobacteraceae bacterium]
MSLARPIKIEGAFDDPQAIRAMVERNGPYPSIGGYLPPSATRTSGDAAQGSATTVPWFRGNWAVNGQASFAGVETILYNSRFVEAAIRLFDAAHVVPTTVVVNVNAPMAAGAVHVDIPSFRGANRDHYPLRLLQAMGTSGLFEAWRIVEAGAVCWFYEGAGGAYDYWPDGLDGGMQSQRPPFDNVALVADNDRMYHRIGWVGDPSASTQLPATAEIDHIEGGWAIVDRGQPVLTYPDSQIRISILWKAQVQLDGSGSVEPSLTPDRVAEIFTADLGIRGIDVASPADPRSDHSWIDRLHSIYYPAIVIDD